MTRARHTLGKLVVVSLQLACLNTPSVIAAERPDSALIESGRYLAIVGDCVGCHTVPGGKPFAGGLPLPTPLGAIIATNITPSKTAGIGNYTLAQFSDALRLGVRADGQRLYPAMPYTSYAKVTDDDARALYAYFMNAVAPVDVEARPTQLPFPFNIRLSMAVWNLLFLDAHTFQPDPAKSAAWNRGAYLTRGLAHCSTCHTPRNLLMAEDGSRDLGGGDVGSWYAPNITSDPNSGVGAWSEGDLFAYMRQGHVAGNAQAAGPMAEAIDNSLRHLTPTDVSAIAVYVKSVPALHDAADTRPAYAWGAEADDLDRIRGVAWPADASLLTGPQLYDAWCATCHQSRGQGSFDGGLPPLFHNTTLGHVNTNNLVMVMLDGIRRQAGETGVLDVSMPSFARSLSDAQLARLGSYLTARYGNPGATVSVDQVRKLRSGGTSSGLVVASRLAMVVIVVLIGAGVLIYRRRRHRVSPGTFVG